MHTGKAGSDVSAEAACAHARLTGVELRARAPRREATGMVNAEPDVAEHPAAAGAPCPPTWPH